jgi:Uma2 family endonuclease
MHSRMQKRIMILFEQFREFDAEPELTVFLRQRKYVFPDIVVQRVSELQQPYPTKPVHLCIEILSAEDRFATWLRNARTTMPGA